MHRTKQLILIKIEEEKKTKTTKNRRKKFLSKVTHMCRVYVYLKLVQDFLS